MKTVFLGVCLLLQAAGAGADDSNENSTGWLGTAYRYWAPRAQKALTVADDYWRPRAQNALRVTEEYWQPKLDEWVYVAYEHWDPRVRQWLKTADNYWNPKLDTEILPFLRDQYSLLERHYGPTVASQYRLISNYWAPVLADQEKLIKNYWYSRYPERIDAIGRVPAPLKIQFDRFESWGLRKLMEAQKNPTRASQLPVEAITALETVTAAFVLSTDPGLNERLNQSLNRVRYSAADPLMIDHYNVVGLDSSEIYAFNTGCSIYVTRAIANLLTDDELAAVIAHEVSHGDQGHLVKNFFYLSKMLGVHLPKLLADETRWFLTGEYGPYLTEVLEKGSLKTVLEGYGPRGPAVEIEADVGAVEIIRKAGVPVRALETALRKLHGLGPDEVVDETNATINALRDYPSLYSRLKAIEAASQQPLR